MSSVQKSFGLEAPGTGQGYNLSTESGYSLVVVRMRVCPSPSLCVCLCLVPECCGSPPSNGNYRCSNLSVSPITFVNLSRNTKILGEINGFCEACKDVNLAAGRTLAVRDAAPLGYCS